MKTRAIVLTGLIVLCTAGLGWGQSLSLDHVDGLNATGGLEMGVPVTFYIRLTGDASSHGGVTNGFSISSSTGAQWGTIVGDTTGTLGKAQFDGGFFFSYFSADGMDADTVGFGGFRLFGPGLPAGFDDVTYTIQIGPIDAAYNGGEICLDSAYYPPSGIWKWAGPDVFPFWDGPHCYTVGEAVSNPEITCPDDTSVFLCDPETVCLPFEVTDAEWVTASEPAYIDGDQVCLPIEESGQFIVTLIAGEGGVADTCSFTIFAELNQPPSVTMAPDSIDYVMCDLSGTICMAFELTDPDGDIVDTSTNMGFIDVLETGTYVCFSPGAAGLFDVTVGATDACGASSSATRRVNVIEGESPVVECPENITETICGAQMYCFPVSISPDTARVTVSPPGSWVAEQGQVCIPVEESGVFDIAIIAQTECGVDSCHVLMDMTVKELPQIECPGWNELMFAEEAEVVCIDLPITNADIVNVAGGDGSWDAGQLCFTADTTGRYLFTVTASNSCAEDTCQVIVQVQVGTADFTTTVRPDPMRVVDAWRVDPVAVMVYLGNLAEGHTVADIDPASITINGTLVPTGAEVIPTFPGFAGEVLQITEPAYDLIEFYMPVYDTSLTSYTVSGRFTDGAEFTETGMFRLIGILVGDVNLDGGVDIADLVYLIDYQFQGGPAPMVLETADMDQSNTLDISDLMMLIDHMFDL